MIEEEENNKIEKLIMTKAATFFLSSLSYVKYCELNELASKYHQTIRGDRQLVGTLVKKFLFRFEIS